MKMKLFHVTINQADDRHWVQVVSPDEQMVVEFVRDHLDEIGGEFGDLAIVRIDNTLPGDARLGLDQLLETAPVGLASFAEGLGWTAHIAPVHRLKLFRIETPKDAAVHVMAPNKDIAAAVWWERCNAPEGEPVLYRIVDGLTNLDEEQRTAILPLLEFGSIGVATWSGGGWSVET